MKKIIAILMTQLILISAAFAVEAAPFAAGRYNVGKYTAGDYAFSEKYITGDAAGNIGKNLSKSTVVSLMYHKLSDNPAEINAFCITPKAFEEDIIWLKNKGYKFCFASEVDEILKSGINGEKYVVITFDDGYESDYQYALPILEKHDAKATFFVIGSQLGVADNITCEHLKILASSDCVEIGNHSYELHTLDIEQIRRIYDVDDTYYIVSDFKRNAEFLESITGKKVTTLSFPNGIWTDFSVSMLKKAGFTEFYTSDGVPVTKPDTPHGRINRFDGAQLGELLKTY